MDTPTPFQQDNWQNNVYVLSTTRVLMALGLTFLIKSLYQLYQRMRTAGGNAGVPAGAAEPLGIDLEALAIGAVGDAAMFPSGPVDGTVEITMPQSIYSPRGGSTLRTVSPH